MDVIEAIRNADALLRGVPADEEQDPRWQAIMAIGEFVESEPAAVWAFIRRWGGHPQEDLRDAVATCLLEHLLEYHFAAFFPQVEQLAVADPMFADTFRRCWQFGQAREPGNAGRYAALTDRLAQERGA